MANCGRGNSDAVNASGLTMGVTINSNGGGGTGDFLSGGAGDNNLYYGPFTYYDGGTGTDNSLVFQDTNNDPITIYTNTFDGTNAFYDSAAGVSYRIGSALTNVENYQIAGNPSSVIEESAIPDGEFKAPVLAAGTFQYGPTGSPWVFNNAGGIASNGSGFTSQNSNAPAGTQVAFLQSYGSMTQSVYLAAGVYTLGFLAAQRAGLNSHGVPNNEQVEMLVDGTDVGEVDPTEHAVRRAWQSVLHYRYVRDAHHRVPGLAPCW